MAFNLYLTKEKLMMSYSAWIAAKCMNGLSLDFDEYCALLKKNIDKVEDKNEDRLSD